MSNDSGRTEGAEPVAVERRGEGAFVERIGRELRSAAELLSRFGEPEHAAATERPDPVAPVGPAAPATGSSGLASSGRWDLESLVSHIVSSAARILGTEGMDRDTDLFEIGATSLEAVELLSQLSADFGLEINIDDIFADARPSRLAEVWLGQLAGTPPQARPPAAQHVPVVVRPPLGEDPEGLRSPYAEEDIAAIEADLELANALPWVGPLEPLPPRRILITGATGFLGSHMLFELLRHGDAHVVCLVRAADDDAARERLRRELEIRELPWSRPLQRRITPVAGDITAPQLGWDDARWTRMAEEVDTVVHVAAAVDFLRGYRSLRAANVLGTLTMAKFAATGRVKSLHHVSTISVFDELGIRSVDEDDPPAHVERLFAGYEKTKWAAEAILRRARERGLVVSFYRPGGIGGHTVTGVYNPLDLSSGFMAAWNTLRAIPAFRNSPIAPVDWVSRIAAELVLDPDSWGQNYNLTGKPLDLQAVARNMALAGMPMRIMTFEAWRQHLREHLERNEAPELAFLGRVFESRAAVKMVEATLSGPRPGTARTDAFVRRRRLPRAPGVGATAMLAATERMARDGRLSLPGKGDVPHLRFRESMEGTLWHVQGDTRAACRSELQLSLASFLQIFRERRIDVGGELCCDLLHEAPLRVEAGDAWVRPDDGVPEVHGLAHPLMRYELILVSPDGQRFWLRGHKYARSLQGLWSEGRTMQAELGREGEPASVRGELVVPAGSYFPEQVAGIEVSDRAPEQEHGLARLIWLAWFGGQFGLGFSEPLLRSLARLSDGARGIAQKVERP